jgi:hypothetical protein
MLQAKTEEQRRKIEEILFDVSFCDVSAGTGIHIDDYVSFDKLAELVDYLRLVNKPRKSGLDMSIVATEMREAVDTWLAYKKERHESYKPTGFKTFYKRLCELSGNNPQVAMAIIEQSMQNNYAGLFPLRNNNNNVNYGRETITDKIRRTVEEANVFSQQLADRIGSQQQADVCDGDNDEVW